jgi:hypothetical protein
MPAQPVMRSKFGEANIVRGRCFSTEEDSFAAKGIVWAACPGE